MKYRSFRDIMRIWPSTLALSKEIKVPEQRAYGWFRRDSIPSQYWADIATASERRTDPPVTVDILSEIKRLKDATLRRSENNYR